LQCGNGGECTRQFCDPSKGCVAEPVTCPDGGICQLFMACHEIPVLQEIKEIETLLFTFDRCTNWFKISEQIVEDGGCRRVWRALTKTVEKTFDVERTLVRVEECREKCVVTKKSFTDTQSAERTVVEIVPILIDDRQSGGPQGLSGCLARPPSDSCTLQ